MCYVVHRRRWCYRRGVLLSHRNHCQHHYHHQHQQWCYGVGYGGNLSQAVAPVLVTFGQLELLARIRAVVSKIAYLRIRLAAVPGNVDALFYKEQWNGRTYRSL